MTEQLDDIVARSTIPLGNGFQEHEIDRLFLHIERTLPGKVHYRIQTEKDAVIDNGKIYLQAQQLSIVGSFTRNDGAFAEFTCHPSKNGILTVDQLKFETLLDFTVAQHNPDQVALWDRVREITQQYLAQQTVVPLPTRERHCDD